MKARARLMLPPRMRQKQTSSGKIYFYYDTCCKPRKWIPLGPDYLAALKEYADLELKYNEELQARINEETTFAYVANRYMREVMPTKAISTQKGNLRELDKLMSFFNDPPVPINMIEPKHIAEYIKWRSATAKIRANREVALFSHIFNHAREWGYTKNANPCLGVRKNKETGRSVYISDEMFWLVYDKADRHIKCVMIVSYLTGQRVADNLKILLDHIHDGAIWFVQNKTGTRLRVELCGELAELVENIIATRGKVTHRYLFTSANGQPLSYDSLRYGMAKARRLANVPKELFQFRDLRAKSGTDKEDAMGLEAARQLLGHKTTAMTTHYVRHRKGKLVAPTTEKLRRKKDEM